MAATAQQMNRDNPLVNDPATDSSLDWDGQQDLPLDPNADTDTAGGAADPGADAQAKAAEDAAKAAEEVAKAAKADKPPEGYVPHGALHEERRRRQALEAEISSMNARFKDVLDSVGKIVEPKTPSAATSFDDDPLAYLKNELAATRAKIAELEQDKTQRVRANEESTRQQQFYRTVAAQVATYRRDKPDYDNAYEYLQRKRVDDLTTMGVPPDQMAQVLDAEQQWLAATALEQGKNPGELVYTMAQKWGYKPVQPNGEAERIKQIEANQAKSKSLANAGGTPSLQDLSRLGDDEFDAALKELGLK